MTNREWESSADLPAMIAALANYPTTFRDRRHPRFRRDREVRWYAEIFLSLWPGVEAECPPFHRAALHSATTGQPMTEEMEAWIGPAEVPARRVGDATLPYLGEYLLATLSSYSLASTAKVRLDRFLRLSRVTLPCPDCTGMVVTRVCPACRGLGRRCTRLATLEEPIRLLREIAPPPARMAKSSHPVQNRSYVVPCDECPDPKDSAFLNSVRAWTGPRSWKKSLPLEVSPNCFACGDTGRKIKWHPHPWATPPVVALLAAARAGDLESLPVLADALEDAGCTDQDILSHLRTKTRHARNCWVLDWLENVECVR